MNLSLLDILDRLNQLENRVNLLEKENNSLKNGKAIKRKIDVLDWLNHELDIVPTMTFQKWILSLQYDKSIQTVFREGLIPGIIEALDNGINEFDVSAVNTGGCSVTMDKSDLTPNMNYEQYYRFLTNYL